MSVASQVYEGRHRRRRRKEVAAAVPSVTIIESPDYSSSSNMGNENKSSMLEEDCTEMIICSTTSSPVIKASSNNIPPPTRIEDHTWGSKKCRRLSKPTMRNCWIVLIIAISLICNNSSCYAFQSTNNNHGRIYIATNQHRRRMVS